VPAQRIATELPSISKDLRLNCIAIIEALSPCSGRDAGHVVRGRFCDVAAIGQPGAAA
jgi:hypothetical protein